MDKSRGARSRALEGAEALFRTQGYAATGLTQILEVSAAPKGSFYFHFPGGKQQLAREVLEAYGARVLAGLRALTARHSGDPAGFARALCASMAQEMADSGWTLGCAAQNLANELAPLDAGFADSVAATFDGWIAVIADAIHGAYDSRALASRRATALLASLEGAKTLARAARSEAPFLAVNEWMAAELAPRPRG